MSVITMGLIAGSLSLGQPTAKVRLDAATMENVANWREVTGRVRAFRRSSLATQEAGLVINVGFDEGNRIEAGQVLVRLDENRAYLELVQAEAVKASRDAMVDERTADVADAERDLVRMQESADAGSATESEVEDAETNVTRAEARLAEAKADVANASAQVALAQRRFDDMSIEAPFAGVIVSKQVEVGQWVDRGDSVVELVSMDMVEVWLDIPSQFLAMLEREDNYVRVRIDAIGSEVETKIVGFVPEVDELSRMAPVRIELSNEDGRMKPGMAVVGLVPTGLTQMHMTVHKDAILRDDAGEYVYFDAGGMAAPARIERLFAVGNRVAIRPNSLPPGAMLVVEGNERLFPGQPLEVLGQGDG